MLYTAAALVSAFQAPGLMASTGRTPSVVMDTSWRRSYNGRGADVTPNPVVAAAPAAPAIAAAPASTLSVEQACVFLADVSLDCTTADKKAYLSSNGVSDFVIAQAECVAPESNVQGHPQLPGAAAAGGDSVMTVAQACVFLADGSASTADKKAYLASKGVSDFVIAQAECVSPESNVQGHPQLPGAAAAGDSVLSVAQACVFLADGSASTADKKAYLASKGVSDFVIAQAECVSPESNVQGHPQLPGAAAAGGDSVLSVAQACVFLADGSASTADKKAYLSSKGVSDFVIAQAECVSPESNVQGHPELPGAEMKGVVVPTADAATAEAAMAAELYKMAPAEAADYLAKNREMLIAAGVKVADLDEAKKVIDGAMA